MASPDPSIEPGWVDLKIQASLLDYAKRAEVDSVRKEFRLEVHRLEDADRALARDLSNEAKERADLGTGLLKDISKKLDSPGFWKVILTIGAVILSALLGPLVQHLFVRFFLD